MVVGKSTRDEEITLEGQEAVNKWLEGREKWNVWVKENPNANVDFRDVNFNKITKSKNLDGISFEDYEFPNGRIDFTGAKFGNGEVRFSKAQFGNGGIYFSDAKFDDGDVAFDRAKFGEGGAHFGGAQFGNGDVSFLFAHFGGWVSFYETQFGNGGVRFSSARFDDGDVAFDHAKFGEGGAHFGGTKFGNGNVGFFEAQFGAGDVNFSQAKFGNGNLDFSKALLSDGIVNFSGAKFGDGNVDFSETQFGNGRVDFALAQFGHGDASFFKTKFNDGIVNFLAAKFGVGSVTFFDVQFGDGSIIFQKVIKEKGYFLFAPKKLSQCRKLDFSRSSFESILDISSIDSPCVLNLQGTKLTHPVDLDNANIGFLSGNHHFFFRRAIDSSDSTSFRRLKKLAKEADDHERALDFFAKEMRSAYWHTLRGPKLALFYLYDWTSDYGRSILRPVISLAFTIIIFALFYISLATSRDSSFYDGLVYSAGNAVPFYSGSRLAQSAGSSKLYGENASTLPDWIPEIALCQGIISGIFIFLIILALRNRFRS